MSGYHLLFLQVEDHRFNDAVYALMHVSKRRLNFYTCSRLTYYILEVI